MPDESAHDLFLSHGATNKPMVRPLAERLRADGLRVWFGGWEIPVAASRQSAAIFLFQIALFIRRDCGALPRRRYTEKLDEGLERSRVLTCPAVALARKRMLCMSANAF